MTLFVTPVMYSILNARHDKKRRGEKAAPVPARESRPAEVPAGIAASVPVEPA
jgi:hypothetical protein